jgi:hypothetical protein
LQVSFFFKRLHKTNELVVIIIVVVIVIIAVVVLRKGKKRPASEEDGVSLEPRPGQAATTASDGSAKSVPEERKSKKSLDGKKKSSKKMVNDDKKNTAEYVSEISENLIVLIESIKPLLKVREIERMRVDRRDLELQVFHLVDLNQ